MRTATLLASLIITLTTFACTGEDFTPEGELGAEHLILNIRAEPPLARGGSDLTFTALTHWPDRDEHRLWLLCIPDPESGVFDEAHTCVANNLTSTADLRPCTDPSLPNPCILGTDQDSSLYIPPELTALLPSGFEAWFYVQLVVSSSSDVLAGCAQAIEEGIPEADCQMGSKQVPLLSDDATRTNINPVIESVTADGVTLDPTDINTLTAHDEDSSFVLSMRTVASSIDEIIPVDGEPRSIRLNVKIYTDCGKMVYSGDPVPFEPRGGYLREQRCEDPADGSGPSCDPVEVEWTPKQTGACKVIFAVWDLFGGTTWQEYHINVEGP